ncbi:MAG: ABC transporter ATP-binding protein [Candidatus Coproplasma sp.]
MKRTLSYLKPYSGTVAAGLIIKFIGSIAELFLPLVLEYVIDDVVPRGDLKTIILMGLLMLGFSLVAMFGNIIANRLSVTAGGNMTHDIRYDLFSKTSYLKCGQVDEFTTPSLVSRLTSDTYYVNQMVARSLRLGVRAPILLIGGIILTFTLDTALALVLLACVPFVIIAIAIITKKSVPCYFSIQRGGDDMVRSMQENITGVRVVKALSKEEYETQKFHTVSEKLAATELKANKIMSLTNPLATLILNLGLVAVIVVGALRSTNAGTVLAFLSYFTIILNAMLGLSKIFVVISRGVASAARIEKVLATDVRLPSGEYAEGDKRFKVQFSDVSFSYNGKENNLENISFEITAGQTLGIIGATGSGKSTVINLLMRLYDVDSGAVYVDGKDVREYEPVELKAKFGAAFQNGFLTADTVFNNVDYFRGLSQEDISKALECAQAKEFVEELEGGLEYNLAQKAANLSGGQKQRLIIARALAANPEILVLDDSSSALDYETDARLRAALSKNYPDSTKIIIAQRVSSVMNADKILVLDDGRAIGCGTHAYLLGNCNEYLQIYRAQMGEEV